MQIILILVNAFLVILGFLLAFLIRYGLPFPEQNFQPYKKSFVFLTLIYIFALSFFRVYKSRFKSSWELFRRIFCGLFFGTLLGVSFVYVFRLKWHAFPTSVFFLSFFVNLLLVFKINQYVLKKFGKIKRKVVIIGEGDIEDFSGKVNTAF